MKVYWISSTSFPEVNFLLKGNNSHSTSGGWILASAEQIAKTPGVELRVAFMSGDVKRAEDIKGKSISYLVLPKGKKACYYEKAFDEDSHIFRPDVVHIHGTEHPLGLYYLKACGNDNVVVSIQGVISKIGKHYYDGLTKGQIIKNLTLRDLYKGSIFNERRNFIKRGKIEKAILSRVRYVIGRTDFDKSFSLAQNPEIEYYNCNETLRDSFYGYRWDYNKCNHYQIFMSQSYYPVKGLHFVLQALPLVVRKYPGTILRIAGFDFTRQEGGIINKLKVNGYGQIIRGMLDKYGLNDRIEFLGPLNAKQMREEYLRANLFICSSTCENSPNSLGEAQLLGVPCLASYVGGIPNMVANEHCGVLYQFDNIEMLAYKICDFFEHSNSFENSEMIKTANKRHDPQTNLEDTLKIYHIVIDNNER